MEAGRGKGQRGRRRESKAMCVCQADDVQVHSRAAEVPFQSKVLLLPGLTPTCSSVGNRVLSFAQMNIVLWYNNMNSRLKLIGQKCKFHNKTDSHSC